MARRIPYQLPSDWDYSMELFNNINNKNVNAVMSGGVPTNGYGHNAGAFKFPQTPNLPVPYKAPINSTFGAGATKTASMGAGPGMSFAQKFGAGANRNWLNMKPIMSKLGGNPATKGLMGGALKTLGPAAALYGAGEIGSQLIDKTGNDHYADAYKQLGNAGNLAETGADLGGKLLGGTAGFFLSGFNPLGAMAGASAGGKISGALMGNAAYDAGKKKAESAMSNISSRLAANTATSERAITGGFDVAATEGKRAYEKGLNEINSGLLANQRNIDRSKVLRGAGAGAANAQALQSQLQQQRSASDAMQNQAAQQASIAAQRSQALFQAQPELMNREMQAAGNLAGEYGIDPRSWQILQSRYRAKRGY